MSQNVGSAMCGTSSWAAMTAGCAGFAVGAGMTYALQGLGDASGLGFGLGFGRRAIATVTDLYVYPIKSCRGLRVPRARVTPRGLEGDRLFLVTDFLGRMQTLRTLPNMATVRPMWTEAGDLVISAPEMPDFVLRATDFNTGKRVKATVFGYDCDDAIDQGDAVADWFSKALKASGLRLVRMPDDHRRLVESGHVKEDGIHITSFADGYPYLLTNTSSLDFVRKESGMPDLSMTRFRPNIVVSGPTVRAFDEDAWREIQVGWNRFEVAKKCRRCQVPRVDPETGVPGEKEPSQTLREHHRNLFGQNLVAMNFGEDVVVGDRVYLLEKAPDGLESMPSKVSKV